METAEYMKQRVDDQINYYERAANKTKNMHIRMQTAIIILGLLVPVVVNLPTDWEAHINGLTLIKGTVTVMSLLLAVLTGLSNFRKYGELWLTYRMTEELLKHEKFLFLTSSGQYFGNENARYDFVQTIESIISSEHNKFRSIIEESRRPTANAKNSQAGH